MVVVSFGWVVGDWVVCSGEGEGESSDRQSLSCSIAISSAYHGDVLCSAHGIGSVHCVAHVTAMHVCDVWMPLSGVCAWISDSRVSVRRRCLCVCAFGYHCWYGYFG